MTCKKVWTPIKIGDVQLQHRVVLAPLTRGRASQSAEDPKTWVANDLMKQYYCERATPGGLLISEAAPVSLVASGLNGIPGWFTEEQAFAWAKIVDGVHAKGAKFFAQIWHQGRTTHSIACGQTPVSSSDNAAPGSLMWSGHPLLPLEAPRPMTVDDIQQTQEDFVRAAKRAIGAGCDGVEIHAGNGYLFDQFHHSNINTRTDAYGGSLEKRCHFTLETVGKLCAAIGPGRLGVRLSPYGFFNGTDGRDRMSQWIYLCEKLHDQGVAYVHLIEPRFDEFQSAADKLASLTARKIELPSLAPFRKALGSTKLLAAGGFGPDNFATGIEDGSHDLVAMGRYFISNADLVDRLRSGGPLYKWDRSRFYGPFPDNELGYTVHPADRTLAAEGDNLKAQLAE